MLRGVRLVITALGDWIESLLFGHGDLQLCETNANPAKYIFYTASDV